MKLYRVNLDDGTLLFFIPAESADDARDLAIARIKSQLEIVEEEE